MTRDYDTCLLRQIVKYRKKTSVCASKITDEKEKKKKMQAIALHNKTINILIIQLHISPHYLAVA